MDGFKEFFREIPLGFKIAWIASALVSISVVVMIFMVLIKLINKL